MVETQATFDWFLHIKNKGPIIDIPSYINSSFKDFLNALYFNVVDKSILLIGTGSTDLMYAVWPRILKNYGAKNITYIEIFKPYIEMFQGREYPIIEGDIRELDSYIKPNQFDLIFWIQGPEHVSNSEMSSVFTKMLSLSKNGLISISPYGNYYDNAEEQSKYKNKYEAHIQKNMTLEDYKDVKDVEFFTLGEKDNSDAVIIGYYFKED